ncbi:MAG: NAD(+)/NADH kinase [Ktedonobacterales bacterium]
MAMLVGIIANPAAAHDIRRLIGHGSIVDNQEKARILRRVLLGLQAVGITEVLAMPDHYNLAAAAASSSDVRIAVHTIEMICAHDATDSTQAARQMVSAECACIVTLGGDGTNRAAAKGSGQTPLLAISTGTNNVIPEPVEGTVAGLAAGLFAHDLIPASIAIRATKRLEVVQAGEVIESALVDIAAATTPFLGARAVTDASALRRLWLTQAVPGSIGLAAIGAHLSPLTLFEDEALLIDLAPPEAQPAAARVLAPIAPGLTQWVGVRSWRRLKIGEPVPSDLRPCVLSLDGERTYQVPADEPSISIRATWHGPRLLDTQAIMDYAAYHGLFVEQVEAKH